MYSRNIFYYYSLGGYQCLYKNRINADRARGSVAIYIKNKFNFKERPLRSDLQVVAAKTA